LLATLLISTFGAAQAQQTPTLSIDVNQVKSKVSPMLYGLMTEEINYSYDGGLYAEMVRNRTFRARRRDVPYWLLVEDGKFLTSAGVSAGIDMALHLAALLTDEATARMAQLAIEYDPRPPFGGIDWSGVNRDMWAPMVEHQLKEELADHPDLLARLSG